MKKETIKRILIFSALGVCIITRPLQAMAGTTEKTNHPYTQYEYTTNFDLDANGSYTPSGTENQTEYGHEHTLVWVDDETGEVVDCTSDTTKHLRCKTCNYVFNTGVKSYLATGHQYNESSWVIDMEPTCTTEGSKHKVCRICGKGAIDYGTAIPALGHNYVTATRAVNGGVKSEATCTKNAVYYQVCTRCGDVDETKYNEIENTKLDHVFKNGKCTACGQYSDDIWGEIRALLKK